MRRTVSSEEIKFWKQAEIWEVQSIISREENPVTCVLHMSRPRGVELVQKDEILKLTTMPLYKAAFFQNMDVNEQATDLETS